MSIPYQIPESLCRYGAIPVKPAATMRPWAAQVVSLPAHQRLPQGTMPVQVRHNCGWAALEQGIIVL